MKQTEKDLIKYAIKKLARSELKQILENQLGMAVYKEEPIADLRQALYDDLTSDNPTTEYGTWKIGPHNTLCLVHVREEPPTYQSANGLKERRLALKHTQRDAALCCGVSTRTWRRYESGNTPIPKSIWNWYTVVVTE